MRAHLTYKTWPGLENPKAQEPTKCGIEELTKLRSEHPWHKLRSLVYRGWRTAREAGRRLRDELQSASVRTLIDLVAGGIAAGLAIPPIREWLTGRPYFWQAYAVLLFLALANRLARRAAQRKQVVQRIADAGEKIQLIIDFQRKHTRERAEGREPSRQHVQNSISNVLQAIADLCRIALQVPESVRLHANLMAPMPVHVAGELEARHGCGIVAYNANRPAEPSWTRLALGDLGAGQALDTGKVAVVEDVNDPIWCGVFNGVRSKCFMSFPVLQDSNKVVAVVNVDATAPRILRERDKHDLNRTIAGSLRLLSDILYNTRAPAIPKVDLGDGK